MDKKFYFQKCPRIRTAKYLELTEPQTIENAHANQQPFSTDIFNFERYVYSELALDKSRLNFPCIEWNVEQAMQLFKYIAKKILVNVTCVMATRTFVSFP